MYEATLQKSSSKTRTGQKNRLLGDLTVSLQIRYLVTTAGIEPAT
jgi:hypothetical protein